jgi:hypothetical protein
MVASQQTPKVTLASTLERAHLNRRLDVASHLVKVALKGAYARIRIRKTGRVDGDPGLYGRHALLHQVIEILTEPCHPLVLAGLEALSIPWP